MHGREQVPCLEPVAEAGAEEHPTIVTRQRRRRCTGRRQTDSVNELLDALKPCLLLGFSGPAAQQLLRHLQGHGRSQLSLAV